jgi:hypothetical protein
MDGYVSRSSCASDNEIHKFCNHGHGEANGSTTVQQPNIHTFISKTFSTDLFLILLPSLQHLFIRKTNPIHPLQHIILRIPQPIRRRMPRGRKRLNPSRMRHVRSATQIDQIPAPIDGGTRPIGYFGGYDLFFEGVAGEELEGFGFGDYETFECLFFLDDFLDFGFDGFVLSVDLDVESWMVME